MTTETATNTVKRTKEMRNRFALLHRLNHNQPVYEYLREIGAKPTLIMVSEENLDNMGEGDYSFLTDLKLPKILESSLQAVATGASITEVCDEDAFNTLSRDIIVLEFKPSSRVPFAHTFLSEYL